MKLFTRYNRIVMLITVMIFLVSSIVYYFLVDYILRQEVDEVFSHRKARTENYVRTTGELPMPDRMGEVRVTYTAVPAPVKEQHSFVTLYDSIENKAAPFKKFIFTLTVKDKFYQVTLERPLAGSHNLATTIILVTLTT